MPVKVIKINLEALQVDRDQIWAEAFHLYQSGEKWWFDSNLDYIQTAQDECYDADPWEDAIQQYLDNGIDGPLDKVHTAEIHRVLELELSRCLELELNKVGRMENNRIKLDYQVFYKLLIYKKIQF